MNRMITSSKMPPRNPDKSPKRMPTPWEMPTARTPTWTETRAPYKRRLKVSLPISSVPSQFCPDTVP